MKRMLQLLVPAILLSLVPAVALHAADPAVPARDAGPALDAAAAPTAPVSALDVRIADIRTAAREALTILENRLAALAPGSEEVRQVELAIVKQKTDTEAAVLGAIIEDARERGDEARRAEAETALDRLLNPEKYRPEPVHVDRPAPPTR